MKVDLPIEVTVTKVVVFSKPIEGTELSHRLGYTKEIGDQDPLPPDAIGYWRKIVLAPLNGPIVIGGYSFDLQNAREIGANGVSTIYLREPQLVYPADLNPEELDEALGPIRDNNSHIFREITIDDLDGYEIYRCVGGVIAICDKCTIEVIRE